MKAWEVLQKPEEIALEAAAYERAAEGRHAWVAMAAAAARHAYPIVIERAGEDAMECGFHEDAPSMDGESEGMKIRRVEGWLAAPSPETHAAVVASIDPSRQLEIWEDDLRPPDDSEDTWQWFMCVGQLCAQSVAHEAGGTITRADSSYAWPAEVCAVRCVVAAAKAIGDVAAIRKATGLPG